MISRVFSILHLCIAFTILIWYLCYPFAGKHYEAKSQMIHYDLLFADSDNFSLLPTPKQELLKTDYQNFSKTLADSFYTKLKDAVLSIFTTMPLFKQSWLALSFLIPFLLLKQRGGAKEVVWLLPLLTYAFAVETQLNVKRVPPSEKRSVFPTEQELVVNYLKRPLRPLKVLSRPLACSSMSFPRRFSSFTWRSGLTSGWEMEPVMVRSKVRRPRLSERPSIAS